MEKLPQSNCNTYHCVPSLLNHIRACEAIKVVYLVPRMVTQCICCPVGQDDVGAFPADPA